MFTAALRGDALLASGRPANIWAYLEAGELCVMHWQPIRNAPLDGTAVLVRCGEPPRGYHLVSYVDGAWMDVHGCYILTEGETGLPTHYAALLPDPQHRRHGPSGLLSGRQACALAFLVIAVLGLLLGIVVENHFDLL